MEEIFGIKEMIWFVLELHIILLFVGKKNIFVFGGSVEGVCEKFDFTIKKWSIFDSYFTAIKSYKVDNVIKNFCCTLNYYVVPE